jgi:hypothetical protein
MTENLGLFPLNMQDEIIAKCKWVGQKLGILDKDD